MPAYSYRLQGEASKHVQLGCSLRPFNWHRSEARQHSRRQRKYAPWQHILQLSGYQPLQIYSPTQSYVLSALPSFILTSHNTSFLSFFSRIFRFSYSYLHCCVRSSTMTAEDSLDVEKIGLDSALLTNHLVQSFSWENVTVTVKDRRTKQALELLSNVRGIVKAGMSDRYPQLASTLLK
jgi:uncharacterized membrane protein